MRLLNTALAAALIAGLAFAGSAAADRGRDGPGYDGRGYAHSGGHRHVYPSHRRSHLDVDLYFGAPLLWPYRYRYYSDPVIVTVPAEPTVYIEKSTESPSEDSDYWYYCPSSKTYYPYVKDCREDWMKVVPQPPSNR